MNLLKPFKPGLFCAALLLCAGVSAPAAPLPKFAVEGDHFVTNGQPFLLLSGDMHYARVPREYWRDRMRKARAMGCNAITTYVFWNLHEPRPGQWDFSGNLDLATYLRTAQEEGLFILLRPGPYVCTEWDFGALPAWLLKEPDLPVRSKDPRFLAANERYMKRLGQELGSLQNSRGGPVIMVQVENEYGSFGSDHEYMGRIRDSIRGAGFDGPLFTSDGPGAGMLRGGTLPDCLSVVNFGGGAKGAFDTFAKFRQGVPRMCGEFWVGWFDHWGKKHATTGAEAKARDLDWMLSNQVNVSIYMLHGGTSWGWMAGANSSGGDSYAADITSYDYDSPLDEAGRPTDKFWKFREVAQKHLPPGARLPEVPAALPMIEVPAVKFTESAPLAGLLGKPVASEKPLNMEALDQSYGYILYRTKVDGPASGPLVVEKLHDYGLVFVNGERQGTLDRRLRKNRLNVTVPAGGATVDILVENTARINFSQAMLGERKGILGSVTLAGRTLTGWENFPLPMDDLHALQFGAADLTAPAFHRARFRLDAVGDTFFDMRGWGKGNVWVNGHHLGRHWSIGPQQSLFCPAPWLKTGDNEVVVLEVEARTQRTVSAGPQILWGNEPDANAGPPRRNKGAKPTFADADQVAQGTFPNSDQPQEVKFTARTGRYVCLQALSSHSNDKYTTVAELYLLDDKGATLPREKWTVAYVDSEETQAEDGSADNVLDLQPTTFWHTQWDGAQPPHPHSIVLDLGEERTFTGLRYYPRLESKNGRVKDYRLLVRKEPFTGTK